MDTMNFKGDLPEQCPPKDARKPNPGEVVYRLGGIENTYNETDFLSHWDRCIDKRAHYVTAPGECQAKALSVFTSEEEARKACKLPQLKRKMKSLLYLTLQPTDGLLLQTGSNKAHCSFWVSCTFDANNTNVKVLPL